MTTTTTHDLPTMTNNRREQTMTTTEPTTTTTTPRDDLLAAAERVALHRARRANTARDMQAGADMARIARVMGDDTASASILNAIAAASAHGEPIDTQAIAATAWANARMTRAHATRADVRREARERAATGEAIANPCSECHGTGRGSCITRRLTGDTLARLIVAAHAPLAGRETFRVIATTGDANDATVTAWAMGDTATDCDACHGTGRMERDTFDARVAAQYGDDMTSKRVARVTQSRAVRTFATVDDPANVKRAVLAAMVRHAGPLALGETMPTMGAVAGAIAADGPLARVDHDPASCTRQPCRTCRTIRARAAIEAGPLARSPKRGKVSPRRAAYGDRAIPEQTTTREVRMIREASLARALDRGAHFVARHDQHRESTAPDDHGRDDTGRGHLLAALGAIVTTYGRRGERVAWAEYVAGHNAKYGDRVNVHTWRAAVTGDIAAWAKDRGLLVTGRDMKRYGRAAGHTVRELAAMVTASQVRAAASERANHDHDTGDAAAMVARHVGRAIAITAARMTRQASERETYRATLQARATATALRAKYGDAVASAYATFGPRYVVDHA